MDLTGWNERYRSQPDAQDEPTQLVVETAGALKPGRALDLACGAGRNTIWLAEHGWEVTAVDGAEHATALTAAHAAARDLQVTVVTADLEHHGYAIEENAWDLIVIAYYLQLDLVEAAKQGLHPGGVLLVIVHITAPNEEPTNHRLRPGELRRVFEGWEILHDYEGYPRDAAHKRGVAEIVARRPSR